MELGRQSASQSVSQPHSQSPSQSVSQIEKEHFLISNDLLLIFSVLICEFCQEKDENEDVDVDVDADADVDVDDNDCDYDAKTGEGHKKTWKKNLFKGRWNKLTV